MSKKVLMLGDIEIEKNKLFCHNIPVPVRGVDIEKVLVPN